jgi:predicted dehydrogenase
MSDMNRSSRRKFLEQIGCTTLAFAAAPLATLAEEKKEERILFYEKKISAGDKIRLGVIGLGIMGYGDVNTALKVPGVELAAACDLYKGRLEHARELYGKDLFITRDYRELLNRKDIDAVIIATSDHWHARISKDALRSGKHVYCEKPMVHKISEGHSVIEAHKASKKTMQIGSSRVSSIVFAKAAELFRSGEIGRLNIVEAAFDRQSALGAWEYTMPTDGSPQTVDWDRYIEGMNKQPYDPKKFFWWRNYRDFGTGVSGDLFVHLLSGLHTITGSKGPEKIVATGQLAHWKDGRDVPDVMTAILEYPESADHPAFQVNLRVNFISGAGDTGYTRLVGEEGVINLHNNSFTISHSLMSKAPGIGGWDALMTYPKAMQETLLKQYNEKYSKSDQEEPHKNDITFKAPEGYDERLDHFVNFFDGVRTGKPVVEDSVFGFRAAGPCLACNDSYFEKKVIYWDPEKMAVRKGV